MYLKAVDIKGKGLVTCLVEQVSEAVFKDKQTGQDKHQLVLHFRGCKKILGLNVTNAKVMEALYGDETDAWIGKKIQVFATICQHPDGKMGDCVRLQPVPGSMPASSAPHQAPAAAPNPRQAAPPPPPADDFPDFGGDAPPHDVPPADPSDDGSGIPF
jgi:hypothetical protein